MQYLGCGVTYIEPSLEFPAAFPHCAASNWELGDTDTGLTLPPVNKDNQALIDLQVLYLVLTYWNFFLNIIYPGWFYTIGFHGDSLSYVIMELF